MEELRKKTRNALSTVCLTDEFRNGQVRYVATWSVLTLSLLMLYVYGAPCKARNFNVVYIWTYVWQR
jgi:hypothetical protein